MKSAGPLFVKLAKGDLIVSKLALQAQQYPQAITLLQQANEKIAKAFLIYAEISNIKRLKKTGHDVVGPLIDYINDNMVYGDAFAAGLDNTLSGKKEPGKTTPDLEALIEIKQAIEQVNKQRFLHVKEKTSALNVESELDKMESLFTGEQTFVLKADSLGKIEPWVNMLSNINTTEDKKQIIRKITADKDRLLRVLNLIIEWLLTSIKLCTVTFSLNILLHPHFSQSRYPSDPEDLHFNYDRNHPLIVHFDRIHQLTRQSLSLLEKLIWNSRRLRIEFKP